MVWLERFDDFEMPLAGTGETICRATGPLARGRDNGKLSLLLVDATVSKRYHLIREMVEGGAGVVREIPEDQSPLTRRKFQEPGFEEVLLRRTRLILSEDLIRVTLEPSIDFGIQRVRIRLRPVQLETEAVQGMVGRRNEPRASHGEGSP